MTTTNDTRNQADVNAQARVADLEAVIDRLRREVERLRRQYDESSAMLKTAATVINNTRAVLNRVDSALDEIFGLETEPTILGSQAARVVARLERAEAERDAALGLAETHAQEILRLHGLSARWEAIVNAARAWHLVETSWDADENAKAPVLLEMLRTRIEEFDHA